MRNSPHPILFPFVSWSFPLNILLRIVCRAKCQEISLNITDFSKRLNNHPRGQLILCLAAENKELEQLRSENSTLLESLSEHQAALDIIMTKYRGQVGICCCSIFLELLVGIKLFM